MLFPGESWFHFFPLWWPPNPSLSDPQLGDTVMNLRLKSYFYTVTTHAFCWARSHQRHGFILPSGWDIVMYDPGSVPFILHVIQKTSTLEEPAESSALSVVMVWSWLTPAAQVRTWESLSNGLDMVRNLYSKDICFLGRTAEDSWTNTEPLNWEWLHCFCWQILSRKDTTHVYILKTK